MMDQHQLSMSAHSGGLKRPLKMGFKRGRKEVSLVPSFTRHGDGKVCGGMFAHAIVSHWKRNKGRISVVLDHIGLKLFKNQDCLSLIFHLQ